MFQAITNALAYNIVAQIGKEKSFIMESPNILPSLGVLPIQQTTFS
jgi:hypothetical protein